MAEVYFPFDAGAGSSVAEADWKQMARHWIPTGVFRGEDNELAVSADGSDMTVDVATGQGWMEGHFYKNTAILPLTIAAAHATLVRWDRAVLRIDWTANTIALAVLTGTPSGSPADPALTQDATTWEIPLARVIVDAAVGVIAPGKVVDQRQFIDYEARRAGSSPGLATLGSGGKVPIAQLQEVIALNDLSDVAGSPSAGEALVWGGSSWGPVTLGVPQVAGKTADEIKFYDGAIADDPDLLIAGVAYGTYDVLAVLKYTTGTNNNTRLKATIAVTGAGSAGEFGKEGDTGLLNTAVPTAMGTTVTGALPVSSTGFLILRGRCTLGSAGGNIKIQWAQATAFADETILKGGSYLIVRKVYGSALKTKQTQAFAYTGAEQTWVVPAGVTSVMVDALGGTGNTGGSSLGGTCARVRGTLPVTPGETLRIYVGQGGGAASGATPGTAGWNGGTAGGAGTSRGGGGGGGATDVRQGGAALANRMLVAGGGGGGGGNTSFVSGGAAGILAGNGTAGHNGNTNPPTGGGGATQSAGGAAGVNKASSTASTPTAGALGVGGAAGSGGSAVSGGGGGAGGYYGGGGGGATHNTGTDMGAGGGGGSSWAHASVTSTYSLAGTTWAGEHGSLSLTWVV